MHIARNGIILNTEHYQACVGFYLRVFDLRVLFKKQEGEFQLCCFEFGANYLMVETGGVAAVGEKSQAQSGSKLRFHVDDIAAEQKRLLALGIAAEVEHSDWGDCINLQDPDGNRIGIRDQAGFERQVAEAAEQAR